MSCRRQSPRANRGPLISYDPEDSDHSLMTSGHHPQGGQGRGGLSWRDILGHLLQEAHCQFTLPGDRRPPGAREHLGTSPAIPRSGHMVQLLEYHLEQDGYKS